MKIAVYPGTFDPITMGHYDLIERAAKLFDKLIVVVGDNTAKNPLFTAKERVKMIKEAVINIENVEVDSTSGLMVDYANLKKASALVRGVRAFSDFEYELQMALMNRRLNPEIETIFLMPKNEYSFINSSLIKGVSEFDTDISPFVPKNVAIELKKKIAQNKKS